MSNDNEELDSQNQPTEEVDKTTDVEEPLADEGTEDIEKLKESNKRLFERTKKAEAELKEFKKKPDSTINPLPNTDADELRLIARGLSDDEIDQAKVIAKGTNTSLQEATKSPLFISFQKDLKEQQRKEKAKLSASTGSSQQQQTSIKDLTRSEHEKLAMEMAKNIQ